MTSIVGWVVIGFVALAFSELDMFARDAKPNLRVVVIGAGADMRPVTALGRPFLFTIGLDNMKGAADAHHVNLLAVLPNGLTFQSSEPAPTRVESGNHPVWEIDTLPAKSLPRLFQVTAETDANLTPGSQLEISAEAESNEGKANSADNHASYKIYVQALGPALVFLGSTLDSITVTAETPTTFNINFKNAGNLPANGTRLEATLPAGVKFYKADPSPAYASGQVVTFKLGDLARDDSKSVAITLGLDPHQLPDLLSNDRPLTFAFRLWHMVSGEPVIDSHFKITKHIESPGHDVAVWLMRESGKEPGESSLPSDVPCVIKFANLGNQPVHKVMVALSLGPGLEIAKSDVQPSSTAKNKAYPGGVSNWDIGDLGIGMSRTIHSVIHPTSIPDDGALLTATITADDLDVDSNNNTASLLVHSASRASILKSGKPSAATERVGVSEKPAARPVSRLWRYVLALIVLSIGVLIVFRARRN